MEIHPSFWSNLLSGALHFDAHKWDNVVAAGIVFLVILIMGLLVKSRVSLVPGHLQQVNEVVVSGILGLLEDNIGEHSRKYLPLIGSLGFFVFLSNLSGMIPGFSSPTSNINTTVACAVIVFLYYNFQGLKEHGIGYLKHFVGPMPLIAPLMIPIEIISHLARPFSLSVRLFGNISGEHVVAGVFYMICTPIVPALVMPFGLFGAFLQAFVFVLLSTIYIAGSIAHDH